MKHSVPKSLLSVLLAATLLFSCMAPALAADAGAVRFAVATDVHLRLPDEDLPAYYPESELYYSCWGSGNQTHEAAGLLTQMLRRAEENGAAFVLLGGDLAHNGEEAQHRYFASLLQAFEEESGIPVYVVPGNHDFYACTPAQFKEYYADFGYAEALAADDVTASYTAELPGGFRLIAVDSNDPGKDGDGLNDRLFSWIEAQAAERLKAVSTSGNIAVTAGRTGTLEMTSTSGRLEAKAEALSAGKLTSTSGGITVNTSAVDQLSVSSTSGSVTAFLPETPGFAARVKTTSGRFDYSLPLTRSGSDYVCGDGSGSVSISTTSGDVRIDAAR